MEKKPVTVSAGKKIAAAIWNVAKKFGLKMRKEIAAT